MEDVKLNSNQIKKVIDLTKFARSEVNLYLDEELKKLQAELMDQDIGFKLDLDDKGRVKLNETVVSYLSEHLNTVHALLNSIILELTALTEGKKSMLSYVPEKVRKLYLSNPELLERLSKLHKDFNIPDARKFSQDLMKVSTNKYGRTLKRLLDEYDELSEKYPIIDAGSTEGIRNSYILASAGTRVKCIIDMMLASARIYCGIHRQK